MASVARLLEAESVFSPLSVLSLPIASPGPAGANRRFMPRMNARFLARSRDDGPTLEGIDISFGGMMCLSLEPTWPGNVVELDDVPGPRGLEAQAHHAAERDVDPFERGAVIPRPCQKPGIHSWHEPPIGAGWAWARDGQAQDGQRGKHGFGFEQAGD